MSWNIPILRWLSEYYFLKDDIHFPPLELSASLQVKLLLTLLFVLVTVVHMDFFKNYAVRV